MYDDMQDFEDNLKMAEKRAEMLRYVQEIRRMREELDKQKTSEEAPHTRENIVKEWVENLPQDTVTNSPRKLGEPRMAVPPVERGPSSETDDLSLGAEAYNCIRNAQNANQQLQQSRTSLKRRQAWQKSRSLNKESFNSDVSAHTTMSQPSSIEQLLAGRRSDPEELLSRLGFCTDSTIAGLAARIPPRFLRAQSAAQGINVHRFVSDDGEDLSRPNSPAGDGEVYSTDVVRPLPWLPPRFRQSSETETEQNETQVRVQMTFSILQPENQFELAKQGHYDKFSTPFRRHIIANMSQFCTNKFPEKVKNRRGSLSVDTPREKSLHDLRHSKLKRGETMTSLKVTPKPDTDIPSRFYQSLFHKYDLTSPRKLKLEKQRQTEQLVSKLVKLTDLLAKRDVMDFSSLSPAEERDFLRNYEELRNIQNNRLNEVHMKEKEGALNVRPLAFRRPSAFAPGVDFRRKRSFWAAGSPGDGTVHTGLHSLRLRAEQHRRSALLTDSGSESERKSREGSPVPSDSPLREDVFSPEKSQKPSITKQRRSGLTSPVILPVGLAFPSWRTGSEGEMFSPAKSRDGTCTMTTPTIVINSAENSDSDEGDSAPYKSDECALLSSQQNQAYLLPTLDVCSIRSNSSPEQSNGSIGHAEKEFLVPDLNANSIGSIQKSIDDSKPSEGLLLHDKSCMTSQVAALENEVESKRDLSLPPPPTSPKTRSPSQTSRGLSPSNGSSPSRGLSPNPARRGLSQSPGNGSSPSRGLSPIPASRGLSPSPTSHGLSPSPTSRGTSQSQTSRGRSPSQSRGLSPIPTNRGKIRSRERSPNHLWRVDEVEMSLKLVEFTVVEFMDDVVRLTEKELKKEAMKGEKNADLRVEEELYEDSTSEEETELWDVACQTTLGQETLLQLRTGTGRSSDVTNPARDVMSSYDDVITPAYPACRSLPDLSHQCWLVAPPGGLLSRPVGSGSIQGVGHSRSDSEIMLCGRKPKRKKIFEPDKSCFCSRGPGPGGSAGSSSPSGSDYGEAPDKKAKTPESGPRLFLRKSLRHFLRRPTSSPEPSRDPVSRQNAPYSRQQTSRDHPSDKSSESFKHRKTKKLKSPSSGEKSDSDYDVTRPKDVVTKTEICHLNCSPKHKHRLFTSHFEMSPKKSRKRRHKRKEKVVGIDCKVEFKDEMDSSLGAMEILNYDGDEIKTEIMMDKTDSVMNQTEMRLDATDRKETLVDSMETEGITETDIDRVETNETETTVTKDSPPDTPGNRKSLIARRRFFHDLMPPEDQFYHNINNNNSTSNLSMNRSYGRDIRDENRLGSPSGKKLKFFPSCAKPADESRSVKETTFPVVSFKEKASEEKFEMVSLTELNQHPSESTALVDTAFIDESMEVKTKVEETSWAKTIEEKEVKMRRYSVEELVKNFDGMSGKGMVVKIRPVSEIHEGDIWSEKATKIGRKMDSECASLFDFSDKIADSVDCTGWLLTSRSQPLMSQSYPTMTSQSAPLTPQYKPWSQDSGVSFADSMDVSTEIDFQMASLEPRHRDAKPPWPPRKRKPSSRKAAEPSARKPTQQKRSRKRQSAVPMFYGKRQCSDMDWALENFWIHSLRDFHFDDDRSSTLQESSFDETNPQELESFGEIPVLEKTDERVRHESEDYAFSTPQECSTPLVSDLPEKREFLATERKFVPSWAGSWPELRPQLSWDHQFQGELSRTPRQYSKVVDADVRRRPWRHRETSTGLSSHDSTAYSELSDTMTSHTLTSSPATESEDTVFQDERDFLQFEDLSTVLPGKECLGFLSEPRCLNHSTPGLKTCLLLLDLLTSEMTSKGDGMTSSSRGTSRTELILGVGGPRRLEVVRSTERRDASTSTDDDESVTSHPAAMTSYPAAVTSKSSRDEAVAALRRHVEEVYREDVGRTKCVLSNMTEQSSHLPSTSGEPCADLHDKQVREDLSAVSRVLEQYAQETTRMGRSAADERDLDYAHHTRAEEVGELYEEILHQLDGIQDHLASQDLNLSPELSRQLMQQVQELLQEQKFQQTLVTRLGHH